MEDLKKKLQNKIQNPVLDEREIKNILYEYFLKNNDFSDKKILVIIPDTTRSGPTHIFFHTILDLLLEKVKKVDFMIALGTHQQIPEEKLKSFLELSGDEKTEIFQHQWDNPEQLKEIGVIKKEEIERLTGGLLKEDIPVKINKKIFEYDEIVISGPVFPHEVVGFSGGYKYFFPGICGPEFLHRFHWLGALITNPKVNGTKKTPVRDTINIATSFINKRVHLINYVVKGNSVYGVFVGDTDAWEKAADLSSEINIKYVEKPYKLVISIIPQMYNDIWTAGKGMYKLEPVVEDGGKLIIYAPHITEVSYTHGKYIEQVGYHTRDYFLKQWDKFKDFPGAIIAHSTHVKGIGTFIDGVEKARIEVILATGISEDVCKKINLGYVNPDSLNIDDFKNREEEGILVVEKAGEVLYKLKNGKVPDINQLYKKEKK